MRSAKPEINPISPSLISLSPKVRFCNVGSRAWNDPVEPCEKAMDKTGFTALDMPLAFKSHGAISESNRRCGVNVASIFR